MLGPLRLFGQIYPFRRFRRYARDGAFVRFLKNPFQNVSSIRLFPADCRRLPQKTAIRGLSCAFVANKKSVLPIGSKRAQKNAKAGSLARWMHAPGRCPLG